MRTPLALSGDLPVSVPPGFGHVRLRGAWLHAGRTVWLCVFVLALLVFGVALFRLYDVQSTPCATNPIADSWPDCAEFQRGIDQIGLSPRSFGAYFFVLRGVAALPLFALGALLIWRRAERLPALLLATLLPVVGAAGTWFNPLWDWARFFVPELDIPVMFLSTLFLCGYIFGYTFPDGSFVPRWTRWLALGCIPLAISRSFLDGTALDFETWPAPLPQALNLGLAGSAVYALAYRYRRVSSAIERQQIKWVAAGFSLLFASWLVDYFVWNIYPELTGEALLSSGRALVLWELAQDTAWYAGQIIFAVCLGFAVLRYRLWDIDVIINRALVYTTLTAALVGVYALIVGLVSHLVQVGGGRLAAIVAAGVVTIAFQPLRTRLQRAVNRLMYGERDDPYGVLSRLGRRLEASLAPEAALQTIVETVAQALKLPYAAIELHLSDGPFVGAMTGVPVQHPEPLTLNYQGETVGRLLLGVRRGETHFSSADRRVLQDIAHQAGVAVHAFRLTIDLRRSRERIVAAQEEERRRLRRDLHDGLGPTLASLFQRLDTAGTLIERDPQAATAMVQDLKGQVKTTVADLRRLVYALRPPTLDELGLAGAIREHATHFEGAAGLHIAVDAPVTLPPLPAAVEVAAYRIALEALTNVVRHAQAEACRISLTLDDALHLEIIDDGVGLDAGSRAGVGMASMRERAAEIGGECYIERRTPRGTRVIAHLPLGERG